MQLTDYPLTDAATIPSPALLYFRSRIEQNIAEMIAIAGGPHRLRPHVKTFKTMPVVDLIRRHGVTRFKCATIAEAQMLADGGVADILLAYQPVGPAVGRVVELLARYPDLELTVLADCTEAVAALAAAVAATHRTASHRGGAADRTLGVAIDLETGLRRTGVPIEAAAPLYRAVANHGALVPGGLHYYDGENHQSDLAERTAAADEAYERVAGLAATLRAHGLDVPRVVMGGTPTFPCYARHDDIELSPGTCIIHDWGYASRLPDLPFTPAGLVLGRVVSTPGDDRFTIDVGSKSIAADPPRQRGLVLGHEDATSVLQNEEHWVWTTTGTRPGLGDEVLVVPTHICPTTALYEEVIVVEADGSTRERWPVTARRRALTI
ncbi:MAG: D-TA family PLP-dependent enzyme [Spirochaetota bacterium]